MSNFWYRLFRFEFWPWWALFIPLIPVYLVAVVYTRKWLYFTAANPAIDMGGFFGEKKDEILDLFPKQYIPSGILIQQNDCPEERIKHLGIEFPFIVKPNVGERGQDVRLVHTPKELAAYRSRVEEFIIQEYCRCPLELSILFHRMPNTNNVEVSSVGEKEYLHVIGDGELTVEQLLKKDKRGSLYLSVILDDYPKVCKEIPRKGEKYDVHSIGNHAKGARFINANNRITSELNRSISEVVKDMEGVFIGRLDLKVPSYESLYQGKDLAIFEMNGVSGEPVHIYGLSNVFAAHRDLAKNWWTIARISKQNIKKGVKTTPFLYFKNQILTHFFS